MLDAGARSALAGTRFADVRWHAETDSTNRVLCDLARSGAGEGTVVVADHQTAGRGRLGRRWDAPPGSSVLVSVLLRPALPAEHRHLLTIAVAVAASDACAEVGGFRPQLKWPNDLVVGERKLAGVLAEAEDGWVVIGMGLNVDWPADAPGELLATATTAAAAAGHRVDRAELLVAFLRALDRCYSSLLGDRGHEVLLDRYRALSATIGRAVRAELPTGAVTGVAVDVTDEGHLLLDAGTGEPLTIAAGDVVHLRPADAPP